MIQANELRIGNLLSYRNNVVKINLSDIDYVYTDNTGSQKYFKTIPITEEWLLKFGFDKSNRIDFGELKPCYANFSFALMIRHNSYFIDWIGGNTEIKYVHQLQNLYFALTGEELTLSVT